MKGNDILKEKLKFYKDKEIDVHVELINSEGKLRFYNGSIKDISAEFFILNEVMLGDLPIFYSEVKNVEPKRGVGR